MHPFVNWYEELGYLSGLDHKIISRFEPVAASLVTFFICVILGLLYKKHVSRKKASGALAPDAEVSIFFFIDMAMDVVHQIGRDNCGPNFKSFLPLLSGLFVFILLSNLVGLIPGFPPATENISTNMAMGILAFLAYNAAGFKEHGFGYMKQFLGPMAAIAPIFVIIELISHSARPFSLSLRLMGNVFGDHLMLTLFTNLTYLLIPSFLMFFGLIVATVQSFVFTLLTGIYISMAISHDH